MRQYWRGPIPPLQRVAGAALASSTALTDISPLPPNVIPANMLEEGCELIVEASGFFSTTATPTLLLGFYLGGIAGVALAASPAITTGTATAWPWRMRYKGRVRAIGSAGSIVGYGTLELGTALTTLAVSPIPTVAASRTVAIDTTAAKSVTVGAQWGASSASNTITCDEILVELAS